MQIGKVAKKTGLSVDAIRFYERNSLLPSPSRTQGGFRQYGDSDVETLEFIRCAQGLGFTLNEIRELLALRHSRLQPCAPVRRQLEQKLVQVRRKLADMEKLEHELRLALRKCSEQMRRRSGRCPLLTRTTKRNGGGQARVKAQHPPERSHLAPAT